MSKQDNPMTARPPSTEPNESDGLSVAEWLEKEARKLRTSAKQWRRALDDDFAHELKVRAEHMESIARKARREGWTRTK